MRLLIPKSGVDPLVSNDPNDFIFDSDLNTFKIVDHGVLENQTVSGNPTTIQVSHGLSSTVPVVMAFIKYPNGRWYLPGSLQPTDTDFRYWHVEVDSSNIYFLCHLNTGSNYNVDISYYVFEATVSGGGAGVGNSDMAFRVAKSGNDVLTETLLDNLVFDSDFDTLKYHQEGGISLDIEDGDSDVTASVAHNLGYAPYFISYLDLGFALGSGKWSQVPLNLSEVFFYETVTSSVDDTNIYFRAFVSGTTYTEQTLNFKYKIFRNKLVP